MSDRAHLLTGKGKSFANHDGSSSQLEPARCRPGDGIDLIREPTNPRDPQAVVLITRRGVRIGYLARRDARWLAPLIDAGQTVNATVATVQCRARPGSPLVVTLQVWVDGFPGALPGID